MITDAQAKALVACRNAAATAEHPFPEFVACEAAVETSWFSSMLFHQAHNPLGFKQRVKPVYRTIQQKTYEENGAAVRIAQMASFIAFPDLATAFSWRLKMLRLMPMYYEALYAKTGTEFIRTVSAEWEKVDGPEDREAFVYDFGDGFYKFKAPRWSTGHDRALVVLSIYRSHKGLFDAPIQPVLIEQEIAATSIEAATPAGA